MAKITLANIRAVELFIDCPHSRLKPALRTSLRSVWVLRSLPGHTSAWEEGVHALVLSLSTEAQPREVSHYRRAGPAALAGFLRFFDPRRYATRTGRFPARCPAAASGNV